MVLDDLSLRGKSKMRPKTSPTPPPPLLGDVAVWSQCLCGPSGSILEAFLKVLGAQM